MSENERVTRNFSFREREIRNESMIKIMRSVVEKKVEIDDVTVYRDIRIEGIPVETCIDLEMTGSSQDLDALGKELGAVWNDFISEYVIGE